MPPDTRLIPLRPLPAEQDAAIRLESVEAVKDSRHVLRGVDLALGRHGITALLGPPGAGKGTVLRLIAGLAAPARGEVHLAGALGQPALVLREAALLRRSTRAHLVHALALTGVARRERPRRIAELLTLTSLTQHCALPARSLTPGERQRLQIARALARTPDCLLIEDPASGLAPPAASVVEALIRRISDQGIKVVIATSDPALAARLAHDVAFLNRGRVAEHRPAQAFFARPASEEAVAFVAGRLLL